VEEPDLRTNPDAMPSAAGPIVGRHRLNGTTLYAEVRGSGPTILIIPGGAEDAEGWRPVAERLDGHTVVTYDRRGTLRSGREDWPGKGSAQHADDAAALLRALRLERAVVFGGSSAGIIALQLALRHPTLVARALVFEPGYLRMVPAGTELQRAADAAIASHLEAHPDDWVGAYGVFARAIAPGPSLGAHGFLTPPPSQAWYEHRENLNAEPLMRDDIPILTTEGPDEDAIRTCPVEVRFAYGSGSLALFRDIATRLAALRGERPEVIEGAGHALYLHPADAAAFIRDHGAGRVARRSG
jgi:pimeloyl-ACP methyl ester carboxylesterase